LSPEKCIDKDAEEWTDEIIKKERHQQFLSLCIEPFEMVFFLAKVLFHKLHYLIVSDIIIGESIILMFLY
jgi:hypothetical protein